MQRQLELGEIRCTRLSSHHESTTTSDNDDSDDKDRLSDVAPSRRYKHRLVAISDDCIYLLGGVVASGGASFDVFQYSIG